MQAEDRERLEPGLKAYRIIAQACRGSGRCHIADTAAAGVGAER
jgi:hypothetical protein